MSIRHDRGSGVCVCVRESERLHVYLIRFQEHLVRGFEMQVSTRRKVCLYEHRRMFSPMLPGTLNDFFFSLSVGDPGRSKQPQSYKPKGQNETRCDKLLNSCHSPLHPFCLSLASALLWQKEKKKKSPSSYPALTVLVNPSQLQSVMICSLINATGKERSKLGKLKTSQYLGLNNTLIKLHFHLSVQLGFFLDASVGTQQQNPPPICKFTTDPL